MPKCPKCRMIAPRRRRHSVAPPQCCRSGRRSRRPSGWSLTMHTYALPPTCKQNERIRHNLRRVAWSGEHSFIHSFIIHHSLFVGRPDRYPGRCCSLFTPPPLQLTSGSQLRQLRVVSFYPGMSIHERVPQCVAVEGVDLFDLGQPTAGEIQSADY